VLRRPETAESAKLGEEYLFRTQQQVHEKISRQTAPTDAWGAPLAYYPEPGLRLGVIAMMRPQNYEQRAGLYMLEPCDPDRIPVILSMG